MAEKSEGSGEDWEPIGRKEKRTSCNQVKRANIQCSFRKLKWKKEMRERETKAGLGNYM